MLRGYELEETDFASAVAASAHAIHSLQEITSNTKQQGDFGVKGSIRKADTRSSSTLRPANSFADNQRYKETSTAFRRSDSKSDAWEKAHLAKIRKRYDKLHSDIKAWENEKKLREKHRMERKKDDLELRKSRNLKHYYSKIAWIDHIAQGARSQVEEKRKHEESIVRSKAQKMRSTGITPVTCFCF